MYKVLMEITEGYIEYIAAHHCLPCPCPDVMSSTYNIFAAYSTKIMHTVFRVIKKYYSSTIHKPYLFAIKGN